MKVLFVTGLYPKGAEVELDKLCVRHVLNIASNTFQWAVIDGLEKNKIDFKVVSFPFLPCFPYGFKKINTPRMAVTLNGRKIGDVVSYCALPIFKSYSIRRNLNNYIKEWLRTELADTNEFVYIITYSPSSDFIRPIIALKRKYPNLKLVSIVTDLIDEFFNTIYKRSFFKIVQGKIEMRKIKKGYSHIDKFVLLTESMLEKIPEARNKYIVIEGISEITQNYTPVKKTNNIRSVLYTGSLATHSCVNILIDAFIETCNPDFRLIICGNGYYENYVKEKALNDSRIIFKGNVTRDESLKLQQEATVLINPRTSEVSLTRYSFPSKTMEYMSSGTPMIGYRLHGIPNEYYENMFVVEKLGIKELTHKLNQVLSLPDIELQQIAEKAYIFIENNKNSKIQVQKIIDFLKL